MLIPLALLIMASLFSGACVTASVMEYAKKKAAPSNVTEFTIGKVHSAQVHEKGDISLVVELGHATHPEAGLYAITVPHPSQVENADAIGAFGFREAYTPAVSDLPTYLYPMKKANKVKEETAQMKDHPSSSVRIEELNLHRHEMGRVLDLARDLSKDAPGEQKIYRVNLLADAVETGPEEEPRKTVEKTILLVHLPPLNPNSHPQTIAIAGAYEDESTSLYYLLVPPALAFDSLLLAVAVVGTAGQVIPKGVGR